MGEEIVHDHLIHGFMYWNTMLAVVPVLLAFVLFRPGTKRTPVWWAMTQAMPRTARQRSAAGWKPVSTGSARSG